MTTNREQYLIHLMKFMNIPYIWGGDSIQEGLDCSGFTQLAQAVLGLDPKGDQTANAYMKILQTSTDFPSVEVTKEEADLGDMIFFGADPKKATHVAIALGNGLMIEAGGGGSKCTTKAIAEKLNAKVRVVTINRRSDLITIRRPKALPWFKQP